MVLACQLPSCSLCPQKRWGKGCQDSVSPDGVKVRLTQLQLSGTPHPSPFKAGASGNESHFTTS